LHLNYLVKSLKRFFIKYNYVLGLVKENFWKEERKEKEMKVS